MPTRRDKRSKENVLWQNRITWMKGRTWSAGRTDGRDCCPCHRCYNDTTITGLINKCLLKRPPQFRKLKRNHQQQHSFPELRDKFSFVIVPTEDEMHLVRLPILPLWPLIPAQTQRNNELHRPKTSKPVYLPRESQRSPSLWAHNCKHFKNFSNGSRNTGIK